MTSFFSTKIFLKTEFIYFFNFIFTKRFFFFLNVIEVFIYIDNFFLHGEDGHLFRPRFLCMKKVYILLNNKGVFLFWLWFCHIMKMYSHFGNAILYGQVSIIATYDFLPWWNNIFISKTTNDSDHLKRQPQMNQYRLWVDLWTICFLI